MMLYLLLVFRDMSEPVWLMLHCVITSKLRKPSFQLLQLLFWCHGPLEKSHLVLCF